MKTNKQPVGTESQTGHNQDQQIKTADVPVGTVGKPAGLTDDEREMLRAANVTDAEIEELEARRRSHTQKKQTARVNLPGLLANNAKAMLEEAGGKPLFSGRMIGAWLIARGLCPPVRGYNAFGDAAGGHGLHLPSVSYQSRRHYDLSCAGATPEVREARAAQLRMMGVDVIQTLIANVG